jgi:hypothetical protein
MNIPANGITAEVIREVMPPYRLSTDLLEAMFAAVPAPPPKASMAWRQTRAGRLIHEVAGLMPADAPQARIAAQIVIVREATDDTFTRADAPGLTVEQVCRLRRTGVALAASGVALERCLARRQQKPAPFLGTVPAEGIDVAAIAAGWGGEGEPADGGEVAGEEVRCEPGIDPPQPWSAPRPKPAGGGEESYPSQDDAAASVTAKAGAPGRRQNPGATSSVVTRLDQGPGWTLDVVRARQPGDAVGDGDVGDDPAIDAARGRVA